jgi:hypothetical protein
MFLLEQDSVRSLAAIRIQRTLRRFFARKNFLKQKTEWKFERKLKHFVKDYVPMAGENPSERFVTLESAAKTLQYAIRNSFIFRIRAIDESIDKLKKLIKRPNPHYAKALNGAHFYRLILLEEQEFGISWERVMHVAFIRIITDLTLNMNERITKITQLMNSFLNRTKPQHFEECHIAANMKLMLKLFMRDEDHFVHLKEFQKDQLVVKQLLAKTKKKIN